MNHEEFLERIKRNAKENRHLEAFLLLMAYIEVSLRFYFQVLLAKSSGKMMGDDKLIDTIYQKIDELRIVDVLKMLADAEEISEPVHKILKKLFTRRNEILHEIVKHVIFNEEIEKESVELFTEAEAILENPFMEEIATGIKSVIDAETS